ncbi:MAG: hypothetical protein IPP51_00005 [Bacteroidetes bacterium]|nr:hypothetical protein [Bacteroidota bacterium]
MKTILLSLVIGLIFISTSAYAQCTFNNATSCACKNGSSGAIFFPTSCISRYGIQNYSGGPTEYPQTVAGADNGLLRKPDLRRTSVTDL